MSFEKKVIIITGASSGIGRSLALKFAKLKARVVLASRNAAELNRLETSIREGGAEAFAIPADISKKQDMENLIKETLNRWEQIDIFIANAGQYIQGNIADIGIDQFEKSMAVNFYGAVFGIKEALPHMLERGAGHIAVINSLDARKGIRGDGPYVAAKSALAGFCDVLRQELHGSGVSVTTVFPGRVDTPMIENLSVPFISPKISPGKVADAVIKGIRKNKGDVIVPSLYRPMVILNTAFPGLMDILYRKFRIEGRQK
ncbi:MAG: SDR family NAD(P)-dependent oxidoreductase [Calditrichaceae bacterium]